MKVTVYGILDSKKSFVNGSRNPNRTLNRLPGFGIKLVKVSEAGTMRRVTPLYYYLNVIETRFNKECMRVHFKSINILMADDDPDDRMLVKEAMLENNLFNKIDFVEDGSELMDYLYNRGQHFVEGKLMPGLIFLDLNMPRINGLHALQIIKSDPVLRRIPIIVLTTSKHEEDIVKSYALGVNSYIPKPTRFADLVEVIAEIGRYWLGTVELPRE